MSNILNKTSFHTPQYAIIFHKFYLVLVVWSLLQPRQCAQVPQNVHTVPPRKHTVSITKTHLFMLFVLRIIQNLCTFWVKYFL